MRWLLTDRGDGTCRVETRRVPAGSGTVARLTFDEDLESAWVRD